MPIISLINAILFTLIVGTSTLSPVTGYAQDFALSSTKLPIPSAEVSWVAQNGWSNNSVNTIIFRKNAVISNNKYQFIAYYDVEGFVTLGRRTLKSNKWILQRTVYKTDASDAHKSISIILDGKGYLHISWGHHDGSLNYAKSLSPNSLILGPKQIMTGENENKVTYPEFYCLPKGNLIFQYRDGSSGNGNLVIKKYDLKKEKWETVQKNLIDGEGKRNAYCQTFVDEKGKIHISWVWRESPNVASNHDMCYARSDDGGKSWLKSTGELYKLPITAFNAEYVTYIPRNSELINQTSIYADKKGIPYIASYWRKKDVKIPQYHILYLQDGRWKDLELAFRKSAFSLSGGGTKSIPISRPQLVQWKRKGKTNLALIFRDTERKNAVSLAATDDLSANQWQVFDIYAENVGEWELSYDHLLWQRSNILDLYLQKVKQIDGEGKAYYHPTPVGVLRWKTK
jgi:hypothetical protein